MPCQHVVAVLLALSSITCAQAVYRLTNCYSFSPESSPLDLQGIYGDNFLELCANNCGVFGLNYMGVSDGTDCYCGNTVYDDVNSPDCFSSAAQACPGDASEECGGPSNMAIYGNPAIVGDCPTSSIDGIGASCTTIVAGATPPSSATATSPSLSPVTPTDASRTGSDQPESTTTSPSSIYSNTDSATPTGQTITAVTTSSPAVSTSYISTTDANGSPTSVASIISETPSDAGRTGSQAPSTDSTVAASTVASTATSPTSSPGLDSISGMCSPTTLRSALIDSNGATVTVYPATSSSVGA